MIHLKTLSAQAVNPSAPEALAGAGPTSLGNAAYNPVSRRLAGPGGAEFLTMQVGVLAELAAEALTEPSLDGVMKRERILARLYGDKREPFAVKEVVRQLVFKLRGALNRVDAGVELSTVRQLGWVVTKAAAGTGTDQGT